MQKILIVLLIVFLVGCQNFDIEHPNFDYTSGYFPYQYPVRTIIFGDYIYDNSNDNEQKFRISVAMGGVYNNDRNRVFDIVVDNMLCDNVRFEGNGNPIVAMPTSYYELASNKVTILKGEYNGGVEVSLTDEFFNDPLAMSLNYVIPIRLVGSNDVDTILSGKPLIAGTDPDPRNASLWEAAPKNFTMFAIKYVNEYHGTYFHLGASRLEDSSGQVVEDSLYSNRYTEQNPTVKLVTESRNRIRLQIFLKSRIMLGAVTMILDFDNEHFTIEGEDNSPYTVTGEGAFFSKKYEWGNKERDGIEMSYTVSDGVNLYKATDTLVIRDRDIVMEVFNPVIN